MEDIFELGLDVDVFLGYNFDGEKVDEDVILFIRCFFVLFQIE